MDAYYLINGLKYCKMYNYIIYNNLKEETLKIIKKYWSFKKFYKFKTNLLLFELKYLLTDPFKTRVIPAVYFDQMMDAFLKLYKYYLKNNSNKEILLILELFVDTQIGTLVDNRDFALRIEFIRCMSYINFICYSVQKNADFDQELFRQGFPETIEQNLINTYENWLSN